MVVDAGDGDDEGVKSDVTTASLGSPEGSFEWPVEDPGGVWVPAAERGPMGPRLRHVAAAETETEMEWGGAGAGAGAAAAMEVEREGDDRREGPVKDVPWASGSGLDVGTRVIGPRGGRHAPDSLPARALALLRSHAVKLYGTGSTFRLGSADTPRCALERAVREIWEFHTRHASFDPENSCAQWWVELCALPQPWEAELDDPLLMNNDVGADLRWVSEDTGEGRKVHPGLATITHLSAHGPPTLVLDARPPSRGGGADALACTIDTAWLVHPERGKHVAFDGRLLHGCVRELMRAGPVDETSCVTLHVNIWLNHIPVGVEPFPKGALSIFDVSPWAKVDDTEEEQSAGKRPRLTEGCELGLSSASCVPVLPNRCRVPGGAPAWTLPFGPRWENVLTLPKFDACAPSEGAMHLRFPSCARIAPSRRLPMHRG